MCPSLNAIPANQKKKTEDAGYEFDRKRAFCIPGPHFRLTYVAQKRLCLLMMHLPSHDTALSLSTQPAKSLKLFIRNT